MKNHDISSHGHVNRRFRKRASPMFHEIINGKSGESARILRVCTGRENGVRRADGNRVIRGRRTDGNWPEKKKLKRNKDGTREKPWRKTRAATDRTREKRRINVTNDLPSTFLDAMEPIWQLGDDWRLRRRWFESTNTTVFAVHFLARVFDDDGGHRRVGGKYSGVERTCNVVAPVDGQRRLRAATIIIIILTGRGGVRSRHIRTENRRL